MSAHLGIEKGLSGPDGGKCRGGEVGTHVRHGKACFTTGRSCLKEKRFSMDGAVDKLRKIGAKHMRGHP